MAASVVQSGGTQNGTTAQTTIALTLGATPTVGNLLIASVGWRGGTGTTLTVPSGWTSQAGPVAVGTTETQQLLTRIVQSGDGASWTFTVSAAQMLSLGMREVSGQAASGYINQIATQGNSSANVLTTASITPTVDNCLILADFAYAGGDVTTPKASWTEDYSSVNTTENNSQSPEGQSIAQTTAAAISGSCTLAGGHAHTSTGIIVAIAPLVVTDTFPAYMAQYVYATSVGALRL